MKVNKSNFGWIFACVLLFILLGISLYLGISGWFFKNDFSYTTDLELGKTVSIDVKKNQANAISLSFDGSYLSGERLPQILSIKNSDAEQEVYVRAKIYVCTGSNINTDMGLVETINWQYDENDNYYYFNDLLAPNEKVALCSHVIIGEDSSFVGHTKYILTVIFESLSKEMDVEQIWGKNPIQNI